MSQTAQVTAAPVVGPTPAATAAPTTAADPDAGSRTPALLRRLSLVVVVTGLVVALVGTLAMALLGRSLDKAEADTAQLVRVQRIETDLLVADANATNTFLVGGLESAERRAAYENALAEVGSLVAEAATAQPADAAALAALNDQVLDYAALVESARANNRQGFPVGAQYLQQASTGLRSDTLPVADALVTANAQRARDAMSAAWGWPLVIVTLLGLAVLVAGQVWLARRFRRRVNPGMAAASLVLLGLLVAGALALTVLGVSVRDVRDGDFAEVKDIATARTQANLAKSSESLTLIARGSGQPYEQSWQGSAAVVDQQLHTLRDAAVLRQQWGRYEEVHRTIRSRDDGGRYDAAVTLATGSGEDTSNGRFGVVDAQLAQIVDASGTGAATSLGGHRDGLVVGAVLTFLAGLATAYLGRRGVAVRQREYR